MCIAMTTKTTQTYALFAMIPLLLGGFGGNAFASSHSTSYSENEAVDALVALKLYVTIEEESKIATIDVSDAMENGESDEDIKIVQEYLRIQNKMIRDYKSDPSQKLTVSDEDKEKFKKFHDKVKNVGIEDTTIQISYLDNFVPLAYASNLCNYNGPHPQPDTTHSGSYATLQDGIDAIPSSYHGVSGYAAAFQYDYADWVTAYFCADGVFRYQTSVVVNDSGWEHRENHGAGEPNPEVFQYSWPVYWWGFYVQDWHA